MGGSVDQRAIKDRPTTVYMEFMRVLVHVNSNRRLFEEALGGSEFGDVDERESLEGIEGQEVRERRVNIKR